MTPARRPAELVPLIQEKLLAGGTAYREAGELLLEAKEGLKHGEFKPWIKEHFKNAQGEPLSYAQAAAYMRVAKSVGDQTFRTLEEARTDPSTRRNAPRMTYTPSPPPPDDTEEDGYDPEVEALNFHIKHGLRPGQAVCLSNRCTRLQSPIVAPSKADRRWQHPRLRIERLVRMMLHTRWDAEAWKQVKPEIKNVLAERIRIRRAGWFN
jgi:hypothetical protein